MLDGFTLCHQFLAQPVAVSLWTNALQSGWVLPLFRDEVICIHSYIQTFFDSIKGYGKRVTEVKECFNLATVNAYVYKKKSKNSPSLLNMSFDSQRKSAHGPANVFAHSFKGT